MKFDSVSHLAFLDAVKSKALKIIGISRDEAESLGLLLSNCRQIGVLSVFYHLLFGLAPTALFWLCPSQVSAGCVQAATNLDSL